MNNHYSLSYSVANPFDEPLRWVSYPSERWYVVNPMEPWHLVGPMAVFALSNETFAEYGWALRPKLYAARKVKFESNPGVDRAGL